MENHKILDSLLLISIITFGIGITVNLFLEGYIIFGIVVFCGFYGIFHCHIKYINEDE